MRDALYIIGAPGTGKSTLMREILGHGQQLWTYEMTPFAHAFVIAEGVRAAYLGQDGAEFPGTDTLAMNVQPKVLAWLDGRKELGWDGWLAEGDRLANVRFFDAVIGMGYNLRIVHLVSAEAAAWRRHRAEALGRPEQNEQWVKGRETKAATIAATFPERTLTLTSEDGNLPALVAAARAHSPLAARLAL